MPVRINDDTDDVERDVNVKDDGITDIDDASNEVLVAALMMGVTVRELSGKYEMV